MVVVYKVICFSTRIINYMLHIMMHSDYWLRNQDGAVPRNFLCFIMRHGTSFHAMIRKLVYFWHNLHGCEKMLLCVIFFVVTCLIVRRLLGDDIQLFFWFLSLTMFMLLFFIVGHEPAIEINWTLLICYRVGRIISLPSEFFVETHK